MNRSLGQTMFSCFVAVTLCWTAGAYSTAIAQTQMTTGQMASGCAGDGPCSVTIGQEAGTVSMAPPPGGVGFGTHGGGAAFGIQGEVEVVKNQPYQAEAVTEIKQTLANGSHISQTTTATIARDSEGRTVRIQKLIAIGPWKTPSGENNSTTVTTIFDPVAGTHIDYTSDIKVAHVIPMPPMDTGSSAVNGPQLQYFAVGVAGDGPSGQANVAYARTHAVMAEPVIAISSQGSKGSNQKAEPLGTKTIEGIPSVGTQNTTTIPEGAIGNDKDIVITHETWYSPELKLILLSTQDDPRFGQTTYSLKSVQQGEPNKTLFQVPAGYKIEEPPVFLQSH